MITVLVKGVAVGCVVYAVRYRWFAGLVMMIFGVWWGSGNWDCTVIVRGRL